MRGFSLIEVLVALWILTITLLGIVGIQLYAIKHNYQTFLQSVAATQIFSLQQRLMIGTANDELIIWQQSNPILLPKGTGSMNDNLITVCWYDQASAQIACIRSV